MGITIVLWAQKKIQKVTPLEELYSSGTTLDKRYKRLPEDIVKRYIKTVNYLKAARRVEDLYLIKSLHYEKKKGDLKDTEAV